MCIFLTLFHFISKMSSTSSNKRSEILSATMLLRNVSNSVGWNGLHFPSFELWGGDLKQYIFIRLPGLWIWNVSHNRYIYFLVTSARIKRCQNKWIKNYVYCCDYTFKPLFLPIEKKNLCIFMNSSYVYGIIKIDKKCIRH